MVFVPDEASKYMTKIDGCTIRLTQHDIDIIKKAFQDTFQKGDHLWLFGSRVYPEKRGGDIDLYIEPRHYDDEQIFLSRKNFMHQLQNKLGEQKIDIVIKTPDLDLYIYEVAQKEGVKLV